MTAAVDISRFRHALPFALSFGLVPIAIFAATHGGWAIALLPLSTWYLFTGLDFVVGNAPHNPDPNTPEDRLGWYRLITLFWPPVQIMTIFGIMGYVVTSGHLPPVEQWALFAALGILSGTVGIVYAHELMHQSPAIERWCGDILMASVLYSHFRTEHLLVHHRYVGTPKDAVTARFGEGFYRFLLRVLATSPRSAFHAEKALLARKGLPWYHRRNPFWRYLALQAMFLLAAYAVGGLWGVFLFGTQAFWAIFQLELVNYVEHYGLTRKHLGQGKYEHVKPHHSWNADQRASNWLLINLQRHSDHHFKPNRRFPLLQTYAAQVAPKLPFGYPVMTMVAVVPWLWRKIMNPQVLAWRQQHYPEITNWRPYNRATNPPPR